MKKILVTGGSGMTGKYLKELLPEAVYPTSSELNLLDPVRTGAYIHSVQPDVVIHLAGVVGGILDNIERQITFFENNLQMNYNVVRACREVKVKNLITILSTCTYPDNFDYIPDFEYPITEQYLHQGPPTRTNYGYGYAKRLMGVHVDVINAANNNKDYCYLIPCNLFGEYDKYGDKNSHFISALLKKIIVAQRENKSYIELLGTGKPLRQFMYAKDLARVIKQMVETETYVSMNVAPDGVKTIHQLAQDTLNALGLNFEIRYSNALDGQYRKDASNRLLKETFPNFEFTSFETAIQGTYRFLIDNKIV